MRHLSAILITLCVGLTVHAQWWTGWSRQTGLALCLHQTDSSYELYSPLQTSDPIPVSQWSLHNDTLRIECASIGFKTTLIKNNNDWTGTWRQGILKESITFHPADTLFQLRRPQTPQPPYNFVEETLSVDYIDSHGDSVHLEGSLTFPQDYDPSKRHKYPCLMLVSGSGQQNRDEEIMQHRPFLVLANYLASHGIATFRFDDRGIGASTGPLDSADTRLFSEDAEALFNMLKQHPCIDRQLLGIGGHSEGGAIAPMVAARNKDVKFVVMLAGPGCTGLDVLLQQNDALYRTKGLSDSLLVLRNACMRDLFALPPGSSQKDYQAVIKRHTDGLTQAQVDSLGLGRGAAYNMKQQMEMPWMQAFLRLDPASYLPKVRVPLLALGGGNDVQVLSYPNLQRIKQLCPQAKIHELPGLNHLFQHCQTGSPDEYVQIEETFAEDAMRFIVDFIRGTELIPGNADIEIR